ncbi:MAG: hypothetical protein M0O93_01285 [Bacteroidales bacterium]|nr:hypothetical protein [Bacteroidales bacterium]
MTITLFIILSLTFILAMFIVGYYNIKSLRGFIESEQKMKLLELHKIQTKEISTIVTPIQLQAYERLIMLLERINLSSLVTRCYQAGMETQLFKDVMIQTIKNEYEYNQSQQLYISNEAWVHVKNAKDETISLINNLYSSNQTETNPTAFAGKLLESLAGKKDITERASEFLKEEISKRFN